MGDAQTRPSCRSAKPTNSAQREVLLFDPRAGSRDTNTQDTDAARQTQTETNPKQKRRETSLPQQQTKHTNREAGKDLNKPSTGEMRMATEAFPTSHLSSPPKRTVTARSPVLVRLARPVLGREGGTCI